MIGHKNLDYGYHTTFRQYKYSEEQEQRQCKASKLHLTGAARSWLSTLPIESIGSWGKLENQFARNFRSTYKRPTSLEEVKSCMQRKGKTLRSYIRRWSIIKNSAEDIFDKRAVDAFFGWSSPFRSRGRIRESKA
jgi:hypothetical protein